MLIAFALILFSLPDVPHAQARNPIRPLTPGPCNLVSRAEIEQVLGQEVGVAQEAFLSPGSTCSYAGTYGEVTISLQRLQDKPDIAGELRNMQSAVSGSCVREASGFGPSAFILDIGESGAQLHLIRAEREYLMISVLGFGNASRAAPLAEAIARKALGRM